MEYKNILLEPGSIPKEIKQKVEFKTDKNFGILEYSTSSMKPNIDVVDVALEKSKESSQFLVNINKYGKGELVKLPSIRSVTSKRIMLYRTNFDRINTIKALKNVKEIGSKALDNVKTHIILK